MSESKTPIADALLDVYERLNKLDQKELAQTRTLRDWFAGMALQGFVASVNKEQLMSDFTQIAKKAGKTNGEMHAWLAYKTADAMLAEREKGTK